MPLNVILNVHCHSCLTYWEMFFCKDTYKGTQKNLVLWQHFSNQTNKEKHHNIFPETNKT